MNAHLGFVAKVVAGAVALAAVAGLVVAGVSWQPAEAEAPLPVWTINAVVTGAATAQATYRTSLTNSTCAARMAKGRRHFGMGIGSDGLGVAVTFPQFHGPGTYRGAEVEATPISVLGDSHATPAPEFHRVGDSEVTAVVTDNGSGSAQLLRFRDDDGRLVDATLTWVCREGRGR